MYIYFSEAIIMFGILLTSLYIFEKALNLSLSASRKVLLVLWCLLLALLFIARPSWIPLPLIRPVLCAIFAIFLFILTKLKLDAVISAYLLSFGVSYVLYYIASFFVGIISMPFVSLDYIAGSVIDYNKPIYLILYTLTFALQLFLSFLFFRIRRFKGGFSFLFNRYAIVIALISAGFILVFVIWIKILTVSEDTYDAYFYLTGILVIGIGLFIWIRRGIKSSYKRWAKQHNNELHEQEIMEKKREIERLTELCEAQRVVNHSMIHRQAAWETGVVQLAEKMRELNLSAEMSKELTMAIGDIQRLSKEYRAGIDHTKKVAALPSTRIKALDSLFDHFAEKCAENNIDFNLKVTGSIPHMVETVIGQSKLETLVGDHLEDAWIAVKGGGSTFRSVLAEIGLAADHYEFKVYDSGLPFEAETLMRLGLERVTTHAGEGGSGIGFMSTFQTMRECGASLIIHEKPPGVSGFCKSVAIRFDGKSQYILKTYRPESFPQCDRLVIENDNEAQIIINPR